MSASLEKPRGFSPGESSRSSVSVDHYGNCKDNKFEIFLKSLSLKISNIHFDHGLKGYPATPINLPGACQSWFPGKTQHVTQTVKIDFVGKGWTWTNERHFTSQNIKELRKFIYTGLSKKSANSGNTRIVNIFI